MTPLFPISFHFWVPCLLLAKIWAKAFLWVRAKVRSTSTPISVTHSASFKTLRCWSSPTLSRDSELGQGHKSRLPLSRRLQQQQQRKYSDKIRKRVSTCWNVSDCCSRFVSLNCFAFGSRYYKKTFGNYGRIICFCVTLCTLSLVLP